MQPDLDDTTASALLARQASLQDQAFDVLTALDLLPMMAPLGTPMVVGSTQMGVMVWRDIDLNVLCPVLDPDRIWTTIRPLVSHPWVKKLRWTNERGSFNSTGQPQDEGYYLGIHVYIGGTNLGDRWTIDCWFLPSEAPRPEIELVTRMHRDVTHEERLAILWIKEAWHRQPAYRHRVHSVDIYTAVLDHGIRTPDGFSQWLTRQKGR